MKSFVTVLAFLTLAATAEATPAVGDQVAFQGTWGAEAIWQHLSFTAWNAGSRQFKKVTTTKIGANAPATQEDWVNYDDTASGAALQYIVANCTAQGGTPEQISVPAGTFPTCKMALQQGGFAWIGMVPFAVVRIETPVQGKPLTAVLSGVVRGTP